MRRGLLKEADIVISYTLPVLDALLITASMVLAWWVQIGWQHPVIPIYQLLAIAITLAAPAWLFYFGAYQAWRGQSLIAESVRVLTGMVSLFAAVTVLLFLIKSGATISRPWLALTFSIATIELIASRVILRRTLQWLRKYNFNIRRICLVGNELHRKNISSSIANDIGSGFRIAAQYDASNLGKSNAGAELRKLCSYKDIDQIWVATDIHNVDLIAKAGIATASLAIHVKWLPQGPGTELLSRPSQLVSGIRTVSVEQNPLSPPQLTTKLLEDKILGLAIALCLLPVYFIVAIAIKLTSKGPVIFKQKRHGWNGEEIVIYKFRSMRVHNDAKGIIQSATINDGRVTPVGRFLRRSSIDELPQFINVLQGRMSIVGPRPHPISQRALYEQSVPEWAYRYKVKPGITGWSQVNGFRGEINSPEKLTKRIEYDLFYVNNWSFALDIKIILMTIFGRKTHNNAY